MKKALILALILTGCTTTGRTHEDGCVGRIMKASTMPEIESVLEVMGVEKGLANRTAVALMTSRLSPSQVCASLKR